MLHAWLNKYLLMRKRRRLINRCCCRCCWMFGKRWNKVNDALARYHHSLDYLQAFNDALCFFQQFSVKCARITLRAVSISEGHHLRLNISPHESNIQAVKFDKVENELKSRRLIIELFLLSVNMPTGNFQLEYILPHLIDRNKRASERTHWNGKYENIPDFKINFWH